MPKNYIGYKCFLICAMLILRKLHLRDKRRYMYLIKLAIYSLLLPAILLVLVLAVFISLALNSRYDQWFELSNVFD